MLPYHKNNRRLHVGAISATSQAGLFYNLLDTTSYSEGSKFLSLDVLRWRVHDFTSVGQELSNILPKTKQPANRMIAPIKESTTVNRSEIFPLRIQPNHSLIEARQSHTLEILSTSFEANLTIVDQASRTARLLNSRTSKYFLASTHAFASVSRELLKDLPLYKQNLNDITKGVLILQNVQLVEKLYDSIGIILIYYVKKEIMMLVLKIYLPNIRVEEVETVICLV